MPVMKKWIAAARLRTLPLAVGGMLLAASLATFSQVFNWNIFWLALATAILLQILSNFANDYGDFMKGTDGEIRQDRALASGAISQKSMLLAIVITASITLAAGLCLLFLSFGAVNLNWLIWFSIGLLAIAAALKYTMGKNAYGYSGKGDIMVFVFFGVILVWGARFLYDQELSTSFWLDLLPAISYGALSVAVLNVNNIRDIQDDKSNGKITIAVKFGKEKALRYQLTLYFVAVLGFVIYTTLNGYYFSLALLTLPIVLLMRHFMELNKVVDDRMAYNLLLRKLAILTLLFSLTIFMQMFW